MRKLGPYELNCIYTGDARELAKEIPNESINIVFTSPPYNIGAKYENWDDRQPDDEFWDFQVEWVTDAFRVSTNGARLYATIGDKMVWRFRGLAEDVGWTYHQYLVWCKPNLVSSKMGKSWNQLTEICLLFHRGKRTPMVDGGGHSTTHNWIVEVATQSNFLGWKHKVHPAQMPLRVAVSWLARTPGEIVWDPFVGCGTTAMAAKILGRSWLGFEIGPDTAQMARERVELTQSPLFIPQPSQVEMTL